MGRDQKKNIKQKTIFFMKKEKRLTGREEGGLDKRFGLHVSKQSCYNRKEPSTWMKRGECLQRLFNKVRRLRSGACFSEEKEGAQGLRQAPWEAAIKGPAERRAG